MKTFHRLYYFLIVKLLMIGAISMWIYCVRINGMCDADNLALVCLYRL